MDNKQNEQKPQESSESAGTSDYASFVQAVLDIIKENICDAIGDDTIYELADLAVKYGLIDYIPYNREIHGDEFSECFEEGEMIYWWGDKAT